MDQWGRKAGVIYCSVLSIVGGTLLCAAQGPVMFIVFRLVAGAGSWGFLALSTYQNLRRCSRRMLLTGSDSTGLHCRARAACCSGPFRWNEWCHDILWLRTSILHGISILLFS